MALAERFLDLASFPIRSDRSLVVAAKKGDSGAARVLIERYYDRVFSFVSYVSGARSNAEDLTQEVFTRALSALPRFNGSYRFEPWLFRIARNLCIDESRKSFKAPVPTDPVELPDLESAGALEDDVWESISSELASTLVTAALSALPMRQRTALVLREIESLSYSEIGQVIGANERAVEGLLRRARAAFRLAVAQVEEDQSARAICRRTLSRLANDDLQGTQPHLARCSSCRRRLVAIRVADRAMAAIPPVAIPASVLSRISDIIRTPRRSRGMLEWLRTSGAHTGALANVTEMVTAIALTGAVALGSTGSQLPRSIEHAAGAPAIAVVDPAAAFLQRPVLAASSLENRQLDAVETPAASDQRSTDASSEPSLLTRLTQSVAPDFPLIDDTIIKLLPRDDVLAMTASMSLPEIAGVTTPIEKALEETVSIDVAQSEPVVPTQELPVPDVRAALHSVQFARRRGTRRPG